MEQSEIKRIQNFYESADNDSKLDLRGMIGEVLFENNKATFYDTGFDTIDDFEAHQGPLPEKVWELLEAAPIIDFEDLVAHQIRVIHDFEIEWKGTNFFQRFAGELGAKAGVPVDTNTVKKIFEDLPDEPTVDTNENDEEEDAATFTIEGEIRRKLKQFPVLDKAKLAERTHVLIAMRESELFGMGKGARGKA